MAPAIDRWSGVLIRLCIALSYLIEVNLFSLSEKPAKSYESDYVCIGSV